MEKPGFVDRLRALENLTASESKIARYMETQYPLIAFETIYSISEKCEVGTATVTRFVSRLGYDSFSDFMAQVRLEVSLQLDTPIQRFSTLRDTSPRESHEYFDTHADLTLRNIERTRNRIKATDFENAVDLLAGKNGGRLYVAGSATSHGLAYYFYMLATYMRSNVILLEPSPSSLAHDLIDVTNDDTLLAILHYRFSTQTIEVAEWFAQHGSSVVVISDRELTPITKLATVQLYSCSDGSVMFNSRVSTLLIIEALLASMAPLLEHDVYERYQVFEDLQTRLGVFASPPDTNAIGGLYESNTRGRTGKRRNGGQRSESK